MIAYLSGDIVKREAQAVIVCSHGVGYRVAVPDVHAIPAERAALWVHTHWSQEHGMALYGFPYEEQLSVFTLLIEVQGIGPRVALQALCDMSASAIITALMHEDTASLSAISGIGKQTAKKLAFYLRDKAEQLSQQMHISDQAHLPAIQDVRAAMQSLGYTQHEIDRAITSIDVSNEDRFDTILRKALTQLAQ